jgi:RNA polymerase sigma factor (sigma-70 family)
MNDNATSHAGTTHLRRRNYESLTDFELLEKVQADGTALGELFNRHAPDLRGWCLRQVGNLELANDLTAETFAQAFRSASKFDSSHPDATVIGWLYGIAANLIRYWIRRERARTKARRQLGMDPVRHIEETADADRRLDATARGPELAAALGNLPRQQREAIWARVVEELPYPEVAARLRCSEQTVRQRVSRGLRELRTQLEGVK